MQINDVKKKFKYIPLVVVFIYYVCVFAWIPLQGDRYMEPRAVLGLRNSSRVILTQYYWARKANLRILSNLFSVLVDTNFIVSAIISASMIVSIIILCTILLDEEKRNLRSFSIMSGMTIMIGGGIQSEIYLYAKTLYISSALLLMIFLALYSTEKFIHERTNILLCLILIATFWFELTVTGICVACVIGLLFAIKEKRYHKSYLVLAIASTACTFFSFAWIISVAPHRTSNMGVKYIGKFMDVFQQNIWIIIVWFMGLFVYYVKKNKKITLVVATIVGLYLITLVVLKIYAVIKEPYDVGAPFNWTHRDFACFDNINNLFTVSGFKIPYLIFVFFILLTVIYAWLERDCLSLVLLGVSIAELFIANVLLNGEDRISYIGFTLLSVLSVRILIENQTLKDKYISVCVTLFITVVFIRAWNLGIFVSLEHDIANKREIIARKVCEEQLCNTWDYEQEVVFPAYLTRVNDLFFNEDEKARFIGTDQYEILLDAYGFDKKTKLIIEE